MKNSKYAFGVLGFIVLIVVLFIIGIMSLKGTETTVTATVQDKERVTDCSGETCDSYYLVFTDEGVFKNMDSVIYGKFNSSDIQGRLEVGKTYRLTVVGWRIPFMSSYQNIIAVDNPLAAVRPVLHVTTVPEGDIWTLVAHRKARITGPVEVELIPAVQYERTVWDAIAACESDNNWHIDTGNGYRGGLQWNTNTWLAVKPADAPNNPAMASRGQEIQAAENLMSEPWGGYQHWPVCSRKVGLR